MSTFLVAAMVVEAVIVIVVGIAWHRARGTRRVAEACDFPGCLEARKELRRLADAHEAIPRRAVLDIVEGVERGERR